MVFTVEEINRNSNLLPGVKLGYRIMDSCDRIHTSLKAVLSLVSHSMAVRGKVVKMEESEERLNVPEVRGTRMGREMLSMTEIEKANKKTVETSRKQRILITVKNRGAESSRVVPHILVEGNDLKGNVTGERMDADAQSKNVPSCRSDSPVPAVVGLASSSPTTAVAHTIGPFGIPLVRKE